MPTKTNSVVSVFIEPNLLKEIKEAAALEATPFSIFIRRAAKLKATEVLRRAKRAVRAA